MNANENPRGRYNRYPDPRATEVREALARYVGVSAEQILVTNGSDEAIDLLIRCFCEPGLDEIIIFEPGYGMYRVWAEVNNVGVRAVALDEDFQIDVDAALSAASGAKIIFVCSPNNPTGNCMREEDILRLCREFDGLVVVDEAYIEFAERKSLVAMLDDFENLVVLRTLSKAWGAAGIRLGYLVADREIVAVMGGVKAPYNVSQADQEAALEVLAGGLDIAEIIKERERVFARIVELGFRAYKSEANSILFEGPESVQKKLEAGGVIIRYLSGRLRVTVGTREENEMFLRELEGCLEKVAFIDRDGVVLFEPQDDFQVDSLEKYRILPGVIEGLRILKESGFKLVMVSNQNGIGSESFPEEKFLLVQNRMIEDLRDGGVEFDEIFVCPHFASEGCNCRKPKTGMVDKFLRDCALDLSLSLMIGDRETDMEFARNIGVRGYRAELNSDSLLKFAKKITS